MGLGIRTAIKGWINLQREAMASADALPQVQHYPEMPEVPEPISVADQLRALTVATEDIIFDRILMKCNEQATKGKRFAVYTGDGFAFPQLNGACKKTFERLVKEQLLVKHEPFGRYHRLVIKW